MLYTILDCNRTNQIQNTKCVKKQCQIFYGPNHLLVLWELKQKVWLIYFMLRFLDLSSAGFVTFVWVTDALSSSQNEP